MVDGPRVVASRYDDSLAGVYQLLGHRREPP